MLSTKSYQAYMNSPYKSVKYNTYFHVYDLLLGHLYGKNITFIEIGVLNGGSLFMWKELFGPNSRIIGIDLNPEANRWKEHEFEIYIGDQANPDFWLETLEKIGLFDVMLDGGGHMYNQQIITAAHAFMNVKDQGIVIVEDTHTSYMGGFGSKKNSFLEYSFEIVNRINNRSGAIKNARGREKNVFSIQFFESIVAFNIDRNRSMNSSFATDNLGVDSFAVGDQLDLESSLSEIPLKIKLLSLGSRLPRGKRVFFKIVKLLFKPWESILELYLYRFDSSWRLTKELFRQPPKLK